MPGDHEEDATRAFLLSSVERHDRPATREDLFDINAAIVELRLAEASAGDLKRKRASMLWELDDQIAEAEVRLARAQLVIRRILGIDPDGR